METETKLCKKCGEEKVITEFYGIRNICKICHNIQSCQYHAHSFESRLRAAFRSQKERAGELTVNDNLTVEDIKQELKRCKNICCRCGQPFAEDFEWEIGHIVPPNLGGHLAKYNIQLLHDGCNHERGVIEYHFPWKLTPAN
jgi:hypothetical protein